MSQGNAKHETGCTLGNDVRLYPYVMNYIGETPAQVELREKIVKEDRSVMMGAPDEAQFLAWLVGLTGAKKVIEVGVFRGSTTLAIAQALPADGKIVGLDVSEEYAQLGKEAWKSAGVESKVDLRIAPAQETLNAMIAQPGEKETYDLVFIDAEKTGYDGYYEASLQLLKPNGVIVVDNVLWHAQVLDPKSDDARAICAINEKIKNDPRVNAMLLPIADGAYLARKL